MALGWDELGTHPALWGGGGYSPLLPANVLPRRAPRTQGSPHGPILKGMLQSWHSGWHAAPRLQPLWVQSTAYAGCRGTSTQLGMEHGRPHGTAGPQ